MDSKQGVFWRKNVGQTCFSQSESNTFLENFWFRFKTYGGAILDLVRDFLGNFVLESKPFLRYFGAKARHFVRAIRIGRKAFIQTYWTRSKTFAKKWIRSKGFEWKAWTLLNYFGFQQGVFMFKHFLDLKQDKNAKLLIWSNVFSCNKLILKKECWSNIFGRGLSKTFLEHFS